MQRGHLILKSGSWYLRYYDANGCRRAQRLGHVSMYPTRESIELLRQEVMASVQIYPANSLGRFVEQVYLPEIEQRFKPASYKRQVDTWKKIRARCGEWRLLDVRTAFIEDLLVQHLIDRMAVEGANKWLLHRVKHFLSRVYTLASRQGIYKGDNPAREAHIPE
jgi:hypothetical protein